MIRNEWSARESEMPWVDIMKLIAAIVACEGAGLIGSVFTFRAIPTWYAGLARPGFTPPNWVFGPAWGMLYLLMAVSAFLVWRKSGTLAVGALAVFLVQLLLNLAWSIVFFGMRSPGGGVLVIIALWLAILATMVSCSPAKQVVSPGWIVSSLTEPSWRT